VKKINGERGTMTQREKGELSPIHHRNFITQKLRFGALSKN